MLADAQQDKVYAQAFACQGGSWRAVGELAILPFADWLAGRDPSAWVTGPGMVKWGDRLPAGIRRAPEPTWEPGVTALLALGRERFAAGQRDDPFALEPLYLRASSAEEQWQRRP